MSTEIIIYSSKPGVEPIVVRPRIERLYFDIDDPQQLKEAMEKLFFLVQEIGQRIPEIEPIIAMDARYASSYADRIIKGRWPEAEDMIASDPHSSLYYAHLVIKGRWPKGEAAIIKDPKWAYHYARDVLKSRWSEAENVIRKDNGYWSLYCEAFPEK